jgi:hypothetical protein
VPKPIPPPPPQPSAAETVTAVRFVRVLSVIFAGLFLLIASRYHYDARMVDYGRDDGQSWILWKARQLDEAPLRQHPGGRVAWLVGNSVLRDGIHDEKLNEKLAEQGSPWRVAKFAAPRGAAGMSVGMLDELPIHAGDRLVVPVALDNFYRDWLHRVEMPNDRLGRMLSPGEIVELDELSWQERLEYAVGVPYNFYRHQEPYMAGQTRWFTALWWWETPKKEKPGYHLKFRRARDLNWLERLREAGWETRDPITPEQLDWSETQFNMAGLGKLRDFAAHSDVELKLIDFPYRQEYQLLLVSEEARTLWSDWRAAQPELSYFPQSDEDSYYDLRHANRSGRELLTDYMAEWMAETPPGAPADLTWTPETP